jgi:hypothetical protein
LQQSAADLDKYANKEFSQTHMEAAQVVEIEQITNTPPKWRVLVVLAVTKITY